MTTTHDFHGTCTAFIGAAFNVLRQEHVIPTPVFHPYITVGRDYFGDSIRNLPEFSELEAMLEREHPRLMAEPLKREYSEFAGQYIFMFLEACVTRCAMAGDFDPGSESARLSRTWP
jgi:hypothetical protein